MDSKQLSINIRTIAKYKGIHIGDVEEYMGLYRGYLAKVVTHDLDLSHENANRASEILGVSSSMINSVLF